MPRPTAKKTKKTAKGKRHKVALRKSHAKYQWRLVSQQLWYWSRRAFYLCLGAWLASMAFAFWRESPYFRLEGINPDEITPPALVRELEIYIGDHLFDFSTQELARSIQKQYPEFKTVALSRQWNRHLKISLHKRQPLARYKQDNTTWVLDETGTLFDPAKADQPTEGLPFLEGVSPEEGALPFLGFLTSLQKTGHPWTLQLARLQRLKDGSLNLFLQSGAWVQWGRHPGSTAELHTKANRLQQVLDHDRASGELEYARFVNDLRVVVKFQKTPQK